MQSKPNRKSIIFILVTSFLNFMGIGIIIPVLPFLISHYVAQNNLVLIADIVGWLTSIYALCQFLATPFLGFLSDRYGRRPILLVSLLGSAVGYIFLSIGGSLWILFLGRIIDGLTSGDIAAIFAYISDTTEQKDRTKMYGLVGAATGFGFVIGPVLGGIASTVSIQAPFFMATFLMIVNLIWGYFTLPESLTKENRKEKLTLSMLNPFDGFLYITRNVALKTLLIITFFFFLPFAILQGTGSIFMKDILSWNETTIGIAFFVIGIVDIFTQGILIRHLTRILGETTLAISGLLLVVIGYLIISIVALEPLPIIFYAGIILFALGDGLFEPSLNGLISQSAGVREQGFVQGSSQSIQAVARIFGPIIGVMLYNYGHAYAYIGSTVLAFFVLIILIRMAPYIHKHLPEFQEFP